PLPPTCSVLGLASRHVPFIAADDKHTVYRPISAASGDCGPSQAPETVSVEDSDTPPANTTFAVTSADGTGSAKFVIWTDQENSPLGCSTKVACSLVIIPIMGISCDLGASGQAETDRTACRASGKHGVREVMATPSLFDIDETVSGELWWSASNWHN